MIKKWPELCPVAATSREFMYAVLIYGFPLFLLLFEWGLRHLLAVDASGFTGPTLSATGLSFLVPLTKPKILNVPLTNAPSTAVVTSAGDQQFVAFIWILVLAFLFVWGWSCYESIKEPQELILGLPRHLAIGSGAYLLSLIMIFIKEKV
jgi:hypothetical protein